MSKLREQAAKLYAPEAPAKPAAKPSGSTKARAQGLYSRENMTTAHLAAEKGIPSSFARVDVPVMSSESFTIPGGVNVDKIKLGSFAGMLADFEKQLTANPKEARKAVRGLGQRLLDMHLHEQRGLHDRLRTEFERPHAERWAKQREAWRREFEADPELGRNRRETSLRRMRGLIERYGESAGEKRAAGLRDLLHDSGAGDHIEMLRFVSWVATQLAKRGKAD